MITHPLSKIFFLQCSPVHKTGSILSSEFSTDITFSEILWLNLQELSSEFVTTGFNLSSITSCWYYFHQVTVSQIFSFLICAMRMKIPILWVSVSIKTFLERKNKSTPSFPTHKGSLTSTFSLHLFGIFIVSNKRKANYIFLNYGFIICHLSLKSSESF